MSYQVLARKWRPQAFAEVVGQQHVLQALVNALDQQRLHHAYLFTGTRGVGKTTIARLLAKALNCEQAVSSHPCGQCDSCREIEQGNFIDLLEIDAASRTKVEDTRELLDNVQYKPTRGRYKVYLIDEVHMLSRSSFNALLKTLEEPPPHVKFLFATTEAQKIPVTILSRCLQFNLKSLQSEQISAQLAKVLTAEQIPCDAASLRQLAKAADGSMRDALSLTDQGIAHGDGQLCEGVISQMLGTLDSDYSYQLLASVAQRQGDTMLNQVAHISQFAPDYHQLLGDMMQLVHQGAMYQMLPNSARISEQPAQVATLAKLLAPEELQLFYEILLHGRKELPYGPDPRSGFEMCLLRLLAFMPQPVDQIVTATHGADEQTLLSNQQTASVPSVPTDLAVESLMAQQASLMDHAALAHQAREESGPEVSSTRAPSIPAPQDTSSTQLQTPSVPAAIAPVPKAPGSGGVNVEQQGVSTQSQASPSQSPVSATKEPQAAAGLSSASDASSTGNQFADFLTARNRLRSKSSDEEVTGENRVKKALAVKRPARQQAANSTLSDAAVDTLPPPVSPCVDRPDESHSALTAADIPPWQPIPSHLQGGASLPAQDPLHPDTSLSAADKSPLTASRQPEVVTTESVPTASPGSLLIPDSDDPWSLLIDQMGLAGRLRQLAINARYQHLGERVVLTLSAGQKHLHNPRAHEQLSVMLNAVLPQAVTLEVVIDEHNSTAGAGQTPLEIAQDLHQRRLEKAKAVILGDNNIELLKTRFAAELDMDSIHYR